MLLLCGTWRKNARCARRPPCQADVRSIDRFGGMSAGSGISSARSARSRRATTLFARGANPQACHRPATWPQRAARGGRREAATDHHRLTPEQAEPVIRAFSLYFRLVNLAEQNHRIRRARAHASAKGAPARIVRRGSFAAKEAGVSREPGTRGDLLARGDAHVDRAPQRSHAAHGARKALSNRRHPRADGSLQAHAAEKDSAARDYPSSRSPRSGKPTRFAAKSPRSATR